MTAETRLLGSERIADHHWSAHALHLGAAAMETITHRGEYDNEEEDKLGHLL